MGSCSLAPFPTAPGEQPPRQRAEEVGPSSGLECGCLPWWPLHRVGTAGSPYVCCLLVVRGGRGLLEWASAPFLLRLQLLTHSSAEEQGWHHPCAVHHHLCMPPWWRQWSSWLGFELAFHGSPCFSVSGPAAGTTISSETLAALCLQPHSSASLHFCGPGVWRKWKQGKFLAAPDSINAQTAQECDLTDTGTAALQTLSLHWVWIC